MCCALDGSVVGQIRLCAAITDNEKLASICHEITEAAGLVHTLYYTNREELTVTFRLFPRLENIGWKNVTVPLSSVNECPDYVIALEVVRKYKTEIIGG